MTLQDESSTQELTTATSVVLSDELHLAPGQLAALLFKEKLETVQHILTVWRERARKR